MGVKKEAHEVHSEECPKCTAFFGHCTELLSWCRLCCFCKIDRRNSNASTRASMGFPSLGNNPPSRQERPHQSSQLTRQGSGARIAASTLTVSVYMLKRTILLP